MRGIHKTIGVLLATSLAPILVGVAEARKGKIGCCTFDTKDELEIAVDIQVARHIDEFGYSYDVEVLPDSRQPLSSFVVFFLNTGVHVLGGTSSTGKKPTSVKTSELNTVPWGKSVRVGWLPGRPGIARGGHETFELCANSPPKITDFYYEGRAGSIQCTCEFGGQLTGYSDLTPYGAGRVGKTLGPGTYPSNRHEYIVALKRQFDEARKLGWVRSTDAAKEIEEALGNIQIEMQRGLWYKTTIPVFLAKLKDMKNNKQINAETYYLLSVNLEVIAGK